MIRAWIQRFIWYWGRENYSRYESPGPGNLTFLFSAVLNLTMIFCGPFWSGTIPLTASNYLYSLGVFYGVYFTGNLAIRTIGTLAWRGKLSGPEAETAVDRIAQLSWSWPFAFLFAIIAAPFMVVGSAIRFFQTGSKQYMLQQVQSPKALPTTSRNE